MQDTPRPRSVTAHLLAGGSVTRTDLEAEIACDLDPAACVTARDVVSAMLRAGWVGVVDMDGPDGPAVLEMRPVQSRVS